MCILLHTLFKTYTKQFIKELNFMSLLYITVKMQFCVAAHSDKMCIYT